MFSKLVAIVCLINYGLLQPCAGACGKPAACARSEAAVRCEPPAAKQSCRRCVRCQPCGAKRKAAPESKSKVDLKRDAQPRCTFCPARLPKAPFVPPVPSANARLSALELAPDLAIGTDGGTETGVESWAVHSGHDPPVPCRSHNERLAFIAVWLN